MSKTSTEWVRHALNGPTMGTRWSALFHTAPEFGVTPLQAALQDAVERVDRQMSTWRADSDLMRINRAAVGELLEVPEELASVLAVGLEVGRASGGAFDIGMGDAVQAWGFGPGAANEADIRRALATRRRPAHEVVELTAGGLVKREALMLDLNGIAKGYAVDRLTQVLREFGIDAALVGIDGEMRAFGLRPDGEAWAIAVEAPEAGVRAPHSILSLHDGAVATSGDYRHTVTVQGHRLSHTMDPRRGAPLASSPASVTVVAPTCAQADAWATALMVLGPEAGMRLAARQGLSVLFLMRDGKGGIAPVANGLFREESPGSPSRIA